MKKQEPTIDNRDWAVITRTKTLLYPDDAVVRMVSRYRSEIGDRAAHGLDIGCGSGRHIKLLIEKGFETMGLDFSNDAIEVANETLAGVPGFQRALHADFRTYNFPHKFDFILAWGVVFLVPPSAMTGNLRRMLELSTDDGVVAFDLRTPDNWFYGLGTEVESDSYMLDDRAGPYANLLYSFFTADSARDLVKRAGGKIISMEKSSFTKEGLSQTHSWLQLLVARA